MNGGSSEGLRRSRVSRRKSRRRWSRRSVCRTSRGGVGVAKSVGGDFQGSSVQEETNEEKERRILISQFWLVSLYYQINPRPLVNKVNGAPAGVRDGIAFLRPRPRNLNGGHFSPAPAPENFEILPLVRDRGPTGTGSYGTFCRP